MRTYPETLVQEAQRARREDDSLAAAVIHAAAEELLECARMLRHCLEQLSFDQIWSRPADEQNAIGNLLLHLEGNLRQWIVAGVGGALDARNRPEEFAARELCSGGELLSRVTECVDEALDALSSAKTPAELLRMRCIQGFDVHGVAAIQHSVTHFRGHTQEIVGRTRQLLGPAYRFAWTPGVRHNTSAGRADQTLPPQCSPS